MRIQPPTLDLRRTAEFRAEILALARSYTPQWRADAEDPQDPATALVRAYAHLADVLTSRLNQVPRRHLAWFLRTLGVQRLPALPAQIFVQFKIAQGTEEVVRVPPASQVTAAGDEEDIAFETLHELRLFPGALTDVFSVDPGKDAIFQPPPVLLTKVTAQADPLFYELASFAATGGSRLHLDHATALEPEGRAQLRLETGETVLVTDVTDTVVSLRNPLVVNHPQGATVTLLDEFNLFSGVNLQEHVLYLAQDDFLNLAGLARITLEIRLTQAATEPVEIEWEYYGVVDDNEGWQLLTLGQDGTDRFTILGNSEIVLIKPEGEFVATKPWTEAEERRYLRARVTQALPALRRCQLPTIEHIRLLAASESPDGLLPDAAFHNATPLTILAEPGDENSAFYPFGRQPRQLDSFYLASEEAFTKPNAAVSLETQIDATGELGSPSAVQAGDQVHVFAVGRGGHLVELEITIASDQPEERLWVDHGLPPEGKALEGSTVTVLAIPITGIDVPWVHVYVATKDKIFLRLYNGNEWSWIDLGQPQEQMENAYGVAASFDNDPNAPSVNVFVPTIDGNLYERSFDAAGGALPGTWAAIAFPQQVDAAPFAVRTGAGTFAYVRTKEDHAYEYDVASGTSTELAPTGSEGVTSRPFALASNTSTVDREVFVVTELGELLKFMPPFSLGGESIASGLDTTSSASGTLSSRTQRLFVRMADGSTGYLIGSDPQIPNKIQPGDTGTTGSPTAALFIPPGRTTPQFVSMFSAGERNSILEHRYSYRSAENRISQGPLELVHLQTDSKATTGDLLEVTTEPSAGIRYKIGALTSLPTGSNVAHLESPLEAPLETMDEYRIWRLAKEGVWPTFLNVAETVTEAATAFLEIEATMGELALDLNDPVVWLQFDVSSESTESFTPNDPQNIFLTVPFGTHSGVNFRVYVGSTAMESPQSAGGKRITVNDPIADFSTKSVRFPDSEYPDEEWQITEGVPEDSSTMLTLDHPLQEPYPIAGDPIQALSTEMPATGSWITQTDPYENLDPRISWEYWNGTGWAALQVSPTDQTKFLKSAQFDDTIRFTVPEDLAATEVAGTEGRWIRARLVDGDYGTETFQLDENDQLISSKDAIKAPKLLSLRIRYTVEESVAPDQCIAYNNLVYRDQTVACNTRGISFEPFEVLEIDDRALYLGFDKAFQGGALNILFDAAEQDTGTDQPPAIDWRFRQGRDWAYVPTADATHGFTRPDRVTFAVDSEVTGDTFFSNQSRYWLRGRFADDRWSGSSPLLKGIYPNTARAHQAETVLDEIIGSSTGEPGQSFEFEHAPVLEGEEVRVQEVLSEEELGLLRSEGSNHDVIVGGEDLEGNWVRWTSVTGLFDSKPDDRHYLIDRQEREIQFGDGHHGRIPPAGVDNIQAFRYEHGGGTQGNISAGAVEALVSAVGGIESVTNPIPADGGSNEATLDHMLSVGPRQISHRNRAVTPEDFEYLAMEASREVVIARCRPNHNAAGDSEVGSVLVHILPRLGDQVPVPSLELRRSVQRYLEARALATTVHRTAIFVEGPVYARVTTHLRVFAADVEHVSNAETAVRKALSDFLHPARGGWQFGQPLYASDLYQLLDGLPHVHHIENISFTVNGAPAGDRVIVSQDRLISGVDPQISVAVAET